MNVSANNMGDEGFSALADGIAADAQIRELRFEGMYSSWICPEGVC